MNQKTSVKKEFILAKNETWCVSHTNEHYKREHIEELRVVRDLGNGVEPESIAVADDAYGTIEMCGMAARMAIMAHANQMLKALNNIAVLLEPLVELEHIDPDRQRQLIALAFQTANAPVNCLENDIERLNKEVT